MVSTSPFITNPQRTFGYIADTGDAPPTAPLTGDQRNQSKNDSSFEIDDENGGGGSGYHDDPNHHAHSLPTVEQLLTERAIQQRGGGKTTGSGATGTAGTAAGTGSSSSTSFSELRNTIYDTSKYDRRRLRFKCITYGALVICFVIAFVSTISYHRENKRMKSSNLIYYDDPNDYSRYTNLELKEREQELYQIRRNNPNIDTVRRNDIIDLLKNRISYQTDLLRVGSPQNLALEWLVQHEFNYIPIDPDDYESSFHYIQRYIVAVLFYSTNGPSWTNSLSFMDDTMSVCDYHIQLPDYTFGIHCNSDEEITQIIIPSNNLVGQLPEELGDLLALEHISFYNNQLFGALPHRFILLENLWFLQLQDNELSGSIPDEYFTQLTSLEYLGLSYNNFNSTLPSSMMKLSSLIEMDLSHNELTGDITVFDSAESCPPKLKLVYISDNELTGRIHDASFKICDSTVLKEIDFSNNKLTGYFPAHFYEYNLVQLSGNQLDDILPEVPIETAASSTMEFLSVGNNKFTGTIPESLSTLQSLKHLDLSMNKFTGYINTTFTEMVNMEYLYVSNVPTLSAGPIPYLGALTKLRELSLSHTNRNGGIPTYFGTTYTELILLDLHNNNLIDSIPPQLGQLSKVQYLLLNRNKLSGSVPTDDFIGFMGTSKIIELDHNELHGSMLSFCESAETKSHTFVHFAMDCQEQNSEATNYVTCPCCTSCCEKDDECNNASDTVTNLGHTYVKDHYLYQENLKFKPLQ